MLRTRVLTSPGLQELEGAWKELLSASSTATPFQTFEWQSTWQKHFGRGKQAVIFTVYEGNDLVGLYPMVKSFGPWRTLRPMGIGPSDYLHPIVRMGHEEEVAKELAARICETKSTDLIDIQQVRETNSFATEFPLACQRASNEKSTASDQATCLILDLPSSYDAYLQALGKSLRYDVRKLDKSLFKEGKASIEPVPPISIDQGLDILFDQHKRRWKKRGLPGAFLRKSRNFHRDWARQAAANGWLWLSVLNLEDQPIGAIYAMTYGQTVFYFQAGFDPAHGTVSPGTLLVAQTIRRAIEEGKQHFDFMRGDEPYKRRWKPQHVLRNLRFIAPARGVAGQLGSQWNVTGSRLESKVRARLEGRGLL